MRALSLHCSRWLDIITYQSPSGIGRHGLAQTGETPELRGATSLPEPSMQQMCRASPSVVRFSPSHAGPWTRLPSRASPDLPNGRGALRRARTGTSSPDSNNRDKRRKQCALVPVVDQGEVPPTLVGVDASHGAFLLCRWVAYAHRDHCDLDHTARSLTRRHHGLAHSSASRSAARESSASACSTSPARQRVGRSASDPRQLPECALGQHPRSVQGGVRRAGRIVLSNPSSGKGGKSQKIGRTKQARPLVHRISMARRRAVRDASACGFPQVRHAFMPPVSLHKKGAGGRRAHRLQARALRRITSAPRPGE